MAPSPQIISSDTSEIPGADGKSSDHEEGPKEFVREEIFAKWNKPLGLEVHHFNWIWLTSAHILGLFYFYLTWSGCVQRNTVFYEWIFGLTAGYGIGVGSHRYWTHKTYKATLPLQIFLMIMQSASGQYPIHKWCLDHRIHHKYTDTNSDPHNSKRGFWFSHMGWLYLPRHPDLIEKLKTFEMPDLERDPVIRFQAKWYWALLLIFHTALPVAFLHYVLGLPVFYAICCNSRRYIFQLHVTWCVNSFAHMYGDKPYDKNISSVENWTVSFLSAGEGWHNYHHTFPWDYKAAEFGWKNNLATMVIDFFAWTGLAYDMKTVSQKMLRERLRRTGDGSHVETSEPVGDDDENDFSYYTPPDMTKLMEDMDHPIWGWDDEKLSDDFRKITKTLCPRIKEL